jgi:predicted esterase
LPLSLSRSCRASRRGDVTSTRWCAPEVAELSDHVFFFDGTPPDATRRTLVVYLHGMLATTPGFQYVQQRALAREAKARGFAVLFPTSPLVGDGYYLPTSAAAQKEQEPALLAGLERARRALAERLGRSFDETFVVGFSSGAYYASSLALRGAVDVDGYIVLAGGSRVEERNVGRLVDDAFLAHGLAWLRTQKR